MGVTAEEGIQAIGRGGPGIARGGWHGDADAARSISGLARQVLGLELRGSLVERSAEVLTRPALELLVDLHRRFDAARLELLAARERRQCELDAGAMPDLLRETAEVRAGTWRIAPIPPDLEGLRVEISGPPDRRTIIKALNAPVSAFLADFEDSCSPTWENVVRGQVNLADAVRRTIRHIDSVAGQPYRLADHTATLIVRPRGWHLAEKHVWIDGEPASAALFDFALYVANNFETLARRGTGPYLCLPKLESHLEARLWNEVFLAAEEALRMRRGTIRAFAPIETLPAAFEMEEILFELREHAAGLAEGRSNYLFSYIKRLRSRPDCLLPDRAAVALDQRLLECLRDLLHETCQRRGALAMGETGAMAPSDAARAPRGGNSVSPADLLRVPDGEITEAGLRSCIRVGVQYLEAWLRGVGQVPLYHAVQDAATAELCRAQLWQCLRHEARTSEGRIVTAGRMDRLIVEELDRIHEEVGPHRLATGVFPTATRLLEQLIEREPFEEFLTVPAYELLS